jgi:hypothetical protein
MDNKKLSEELIKKLDEHRKDVGKIGIKQHSLEIKTMCLKLLENGMSKQELVKITGLHINYFQNWQRDLEKNNSSIKEIKVFPDENVENKSKIYSSKNKDKIKLILPSKVKIFLPQDVVINYLDKILSLS